jgi:thymidine kinase
VLDIKKLNETNQTNGTLRFKFAEMKTGKSAFLIIKYDSHTRKGFWAKIFKVVPNATEGENRSVKLTSRIGIDKQGLVLTRECNLAHYIKVEEFDEYNNLVVIDEAQFLSAKQVEFLKYIADNNNVEIICYGLRTDFKSQMFEGSKRLLELADDVVYHKTLCKCGRQANVNSRDNDNDQQIQIGDSYTVMCYDCYTKK